MDFRDHLDWDALVVARIPIDPISCSCVAFHLDALDERTRGASPVYKRLDLGSSHRVAFNGGGVVHIVDPDCAQDMIRLDGTGESAEVVMQETDLLVDESQDFLEGRAASAASGVLYTFCSHLIDKVAKSSARAPGTGFSLRFEFHRPVT